MHVRTCRCSPFIISGTAGKIAPELGVRLEFYKAVNHTQGTGELGWSLMSCWELVQRGQSLQSSRVNQHFQRAQVAPARWKHHAKPVMQNETPGFQ